eukprot:scaffold1190_cov69-Cylindrotheca_fusiformis.AAC.11
MDRGIDNADSGRRHAWDIMNGACLKQGEDCEQECLEGAKRESQKLRMSKCIVTTTNMKGSMVET